MKIFIRDALETERTRLEKQFSEQLEELRMEGTEAALRGAGHDLTTLLAAEKLKVIELEKTMDNLKVVRKIYSFEIISEMFHSICWGKLLCYVSRSCLNNGKVVKTG